MIVVHFKKFLFLFIIFIIFFTVTHDFGSHWSHTFRRRLPIRRLLAQNLNEASDLIENVVDLEDTTDEPSELSPPNLNQSSDLKETSKSVDQKYYGSKFKGNTNNEGTLPSNSDLLSESKRSNIDRQGLISNTIGKIEPLKPFENVIDGVPQVNLNQLVPVVTSQDKIDYQKGVKSGDQLRNITQLLAKYGLRTETHYVQTEDGYILTKFRIPSSGPPVFVDHGLMSSSDDFVTLGPEKALAYLLANAGFDVWLGNSRGNKHSQRHVSLTTEDDAYWDFSFDEIGRFDHPATIDYILQTTSYKQLYWVGHSQGTTSFFIMCAERPEYNDKVAFMVALSAVAYMGHTTSVGYNLLSPALQYYNITKFLIGPYIPPKVFTNLLKGILCEGTVIQNLICENALFVMFGFMNRKTDYQALPVIIGHSPSTISTKQFSHYANLVESGKFIKFDYKYQNRLVYGTGTPPEYEVEKITVPMAIFQGPADWITVDVDLDLLTRRLRNNYKVYRVPDNDFGHLDFLFAKDAPELLYNDVINVLKNAVANQDEKL